MRNVIALTAREVRSYFAAPIAYVVTAAFLVICGYLFTMYVFYSREPSLRYLFRDMSIVLLLMAPVLTMRLLSEEQRSGTIELLLTAPLRDIEVVLGKFIAAFLLLGVMLGLTLYYPLVIIFFATPDWGPVLGGYLGVLLLGSSFLALGLLTSSLSQNQVVAAVLSFAALLVLWLISGMAEFTGPQLSGFVRYMGLMEHFDDFTKGIVDLKDVFYYVSIVTASLFLTVKVLETRRWK